MRTIKTYFKGAPFYIASASRNVGFARFPVTENAVSQDLATTAMLSRAERRLAILVFGGQSMCIISEC